MARILIIEDEEMYAAILEETLAAEGHQVDMVQSGADGVALALRHVPDLVLCDIRMKGMDGYAVLSALRRDGRTATIPLIFLTGLGEPVALRKGMNSGADDYLVKPVSREDLLQAVNARLARRAEMRREVQRRLGEVRSDVAKSLPHELLTPLTAVMGLSSMLVEEQPSDFDTVREIAQGIFMGSQALQGIAAKFLLYAELEAAAVAAPEPLDAEIALATIRRAAEEQAGRAGRAGNLRLELDTILSPLSKDHLQRVVEELLSNAFRFSAAGSPVIVRCHDAGGRWTLSVADDGRGFTPAQLAGLDSRLPFSRRHQDEPGVGLGLAIVKRLSELYAGEIAFDTARARGTEVSVRIPLKASE
jgi:two-component system, sensor histidine kinase and response regulator